MVKEPTNMLTEIRSLAALVARDPLSIKQVIAHLGQVEQDFGSNVVIKPHLAGFKQANVTRAFDMETRKPGNVPAHVTLTPTEPVPLETLAAAFGEYTEISGDDLGPMQAIFDLHIPGEPCTVTLIAEHRHGRVGSISLRRDPPL